jgi:cytochrome c oxidase subunit 4/cytochrome o ubiquinol oxidase operon protein cyoD
MAKAHDSHAEPSPRFYLTIGVILAIVTIIEVVIALPGVIYSPEHPDPTAVYFLVPILLVLAVIKGSLVVMFFMHLRGDARVFQLLFIAPFLLACSMIAVFLVLFWSGHVGIAG